MSGSWKVAYADFMTAMMAFFLLMWIVTTVSQDTKNGLADMYALNAQGQTNTSGAGRNIGRMDKLDTSQLKINDEEMSHYAILQDLRQTLSEDRALSAASGVSSSQMGVLLHLTGDVLYQPNSISLTPQGKSALDEVVRVMNKYNTYAVVRGHTSRDETGKPYYSSKWDLSFARANAAIRYMVQTGRLDPAQLRAVAYADTLPMVPDTSPDASAKNRRVEFYFHRPEVMSQQGNH